MTKRTALANIGWPCSNRSLKNLKNEKWHDIDEFGGYYQVSNYGRVKSLPRFVEIWIPKRQLSISYYTKEKILSIKVHKKLNTIINETYYECTIGIHYNKQERTFLVSRLVYHAFVAKLDFDEDRLMIMHKDGNGLNNYCKNLIAGTRSAVTQKSYKLKRHTSPFRLKSRKEIVAISKRAAISRQKPIIQLSQSGREIKRFESIKSASLATGIADSGIVRVLKRQGHTAGGFVWRYETQ